jgi:hypothetical protein
MPSAGVIAVAARDGDVVHRPFGGLVLPNRRPDITMANLVNGTVLSLGRP